MPKSFTEHERAYIKQRLVQEAETCLRLYGLKKTTVDELVRRVKIPKGTFYLFYESKELLFFDVVMRLQETMTRELLREIEAIPEPVDPDRVTGVMFRLYKSIQDSCLFSLITNGELELLMRKLPPEAVETNARIDDMNVEMLLPPAHGLSPERIKAYSGALRAVFLSMLHRREIGDDVFDDALELMLRGVITRMFQEAYS